MPLTTFLHLNFPLVLLFILLCIGVLALEYWDNGRGVQKLSTVEAIRLMNQKNSKIIDLRTIDQFQIGHVKEAQHVLSNDLSHSPQTWIKKTEFPVLLIDNQGTSAASTAIQLKKQGYLNVSILAGGMQSWLKENLPLTKPQKTEEKGKHHAKD